MSRIVNAALLRHELVFTASRSDGPGGQNVNKVSSKITLRFNVRHSTVLNEEERQRILSKLNNRLTKQGELLISDQSSRSQLANKDMVVAKFDNILQIAFTEDKKRKKTRPSKSSAEKRMKSKKLNSEKKQWRRDI